jgi:SAM-dependent methyltransferase
VSFQDHFSSRATAYAGARPTYPPALFTRLAALSPGRELVWDCGTGNGQAAVGLVRHFRSVLATDPSVAQIAGSPPHARIAFRVRPESVSGLPPACADLVTVAQAAHWFDLNAFYNEARRVLRPGGILAVWCYGLCNVSFTIDEILQRFYANTIHAFWPPQRLYVEAEYETLPFPFAELSFPWPIMEQRWTLRDLGAYLETWSAVIAYTRVNGTTPVPQLLDILAPMWGPEEEPRLIRWKLAGHITRL